MDALKTTRERISQKLPINVDLLAITIALALAALVRFGVIHQVSF
jgi:hypothetical protein